MQQAQAFGAPAHVLEAMRGSIDARNASAGPYCVWPEHWHAVEVFQGMATQWRTQLGMGGLLYLGLDYGAMRPVLDEHHDGPHRQPMHVLMPQLRTLELAARAELNER